MEGLPEGIDSKFRYVLLVSKRAEQLIQGAMARIKSKHAKPTRVAWQSGRNTVNWQRTRHRRDSLSKKEI